MILPHRSRRLTRALAAATAAAALAAPPAPARIDPPATPAFNTRETETTSAPVVRSIEAGFDWGSAAIGAGGAGALTVLVSLSAFAYISRDRSRVMR